MNRYEFDSKYYCMCEYEQECKYELCLENLLFWRSFPAAEIFIYHFGIIF